ncbi:MAG: hypothetical protein ACI85U_003311 [Candidatus Promineifilaceae bacterium]|jgi:hypothetical protein
MTNERHSAPQQPRPSQSHKSFLLRCWQEADSAQDGAQVWRFSVREVRQEPQEHSFSTPGQLLDFLTHTLTENIERNDDVRFPEAKGDAETPAVDE